MRFPSGLRALNHRDFRLFFTGQLISLIGSWMQSVGQSWLVLELTNSPFKLGLVGTLQFLPVLLFSLPAGAIIDRLPKRRLVIATQTALMVLALVLSALVWTDVIQYWHILTLATLLGIVNTLDMPARQSFLVEMCGKDDLSNGIALNSAVFNGARIVGPAVAGALIGKFGVALAFFLNGISFLAVIAALFFVRAQGLPQARRDTSIRQQIGEGLRYAARTPLIVLVLSTLLVTSLFVMNWNVLVPLLAREVLHLEAEGYGYLMSSLGAGALLGALLLASLGSRVRVSAVIGGAITVSAVAVLTGFVRQFYPAAALLFVIGVAQILFSANANTTVQITTPDALRGRVMSMYTWVFAGVAPIGSFYMGAVTESYGASMGFRVGGVLGLVSILGLLLWWVLRRRDPQADAA